MDFHELEAFRVLAREQHFARAASLLNMSPSALSRLLARLEGEVGRCLLERDTRHTALTSEGEEFLNFANELLLRREDLPARLSAVKGQLGGTVRLYASVTACYTIVPPFAEALHRQWPSLRLEVETGDPAEGPARLREGRADIAVSALPQEGFPDLEAWSVRRTPLVFVAGARSPWAQGPWTGQAVSESCERAGQEASLRELAGLPLILPRTGPARERLDRALRQEAISPHIAAETAGNEALLALVRLGLGIGLVPALVLQSGPFADGLVQFPCKALGDYDIGFIQRSTGGGTREARLREALGAILSQIYRTTYHE